MGKVVTPDPPFSVIRFMSVLPTTSNARRERQLEMLTALKRTCAFPGIWQVHLLVEFEGAALRMLEAYRLELPPRVAAMHELGRMPLNSDFVRYAYTQLRGEWVIACNDDIYPEGAAWLRPPMGSLLLSRHAKVRVRVRARARVRVRVRARVRARVRVRVRVRARARVRVGVRGRVRVRVRGA